MQWFRFYHSMRSNPLLHRLPPVMRWCWVIVLTMASESPWRGWLLLATDIPYTVDDLAHAAGVKPGLMERAIALLLEYRMLESIDGVLHVTGWEECQFDSDLSTERSRKCRQKAKAATLHETFAVTDMQRHRQRHLQRHGDGPDTDTDTDTDSETDTETSTGTGGWITGAGTEAEAAGMSVSPVLSFTRMRSGDTGERSVGRRKTADGFTEMLLHSP